MLVCVATVKAQTYTSPATGTISAASANCSVANSCVWLKVNAVQSISVVTTGTFSASLLVEASTDGGQSWSAVQLYTTTFTQSFTAPSGATDVRVRATLYTSGTATVTITANQAGNVGGGSGGVPSQQVTGGTLYNPSSSGAFDNAAMYDYFISSINSCSPTTEFTAMFPAGDFATEALTGCIAVPSSSTEIQANGIAGYVNSSSTATNAVGGFFAGRCLATNCRVWGENPLAVDGGFAAKFLYGSEIDVNVANAGSVGNGLQVHGLWSAQPTSSANNFGNMPGVLVLAPVNTGQWTSDFACGSASATNGTGFGPCLDIGLNQNTGNSGSMAIMFHGKDTVGTFHNIELVSSLDATNHFVAPVWLDVTANKFAYGALLPFHGSNMSDTATGSIISVGTVSVSASTSGSYTFSTPYESAPFCTITPTSSPSSVGVYWVTTSTTAVTANVTTSGTITFNFVCGPQAN